MQTEPVQLKLKRPIRRDRMAKSNKNTLAPGSIRGRVKNFVLNFGIAIVWLVKSIFKYIRRR